MDIVVGYYGVPAIFKNLVMVGATVARFPSGRQAIRALTMRAPARSFGNFIPFRSPANSIRRWENDSWKGFSGVNVWGWYLTADEERGILYMPFGSPAGNYYGGDRPGTNLFGNSIVAVDAKTGKTLAFSDGASRSLGLRSAPGAGSVGYR